MKIPHINHLIWHDVAVFYKVLTTQERCATLAPVNKQTDRSNNHEQGNYPWS